MTAFHRSCYNRMILPLLWGGSHVFSLFNEKVRIGLQGRQGLIDRVRQVRSRIADRPIILFHCASAGELEALKPIAAELDRNCVAPAVSFFSPSARSAAANSREFDFVDYSPIDLAAHVRSYLDAIQPSVIAITKHDVWPNFAWEAKARGIPLLPINGNFHGNVRPEAGL